MQIGTQLRQKVVRLCLAGLPNRAQNCQTSFSELSNYPYVGLSPDQVIKTAGTQARTLIKVKIDFSKAKSSPRTKPTNSPSNTMTRCSWACASTLHNCQECSSIAGDDRHSTPSNRWCKTARHFRSKFSATTSAPARAKS